MHSKHTRDSGTVWRRDADVLVTVSGAAGLVVSDGHGGGILSSGLTVPGRVRAAHLREAPVLRLLLTSQCPDLAFLQGSAYMWGARGAARGMAARKGSRSQFEFPIHTSLGNDDLQARASSFPAKGRHCGFSWT